MVITSVKQVNFTLFVSNITEKKLLNQFPQNSVGRWHMWYERTRKILVVINDYIALGLG